VDLVQKGLRSHGRDVTCINAGHSGGSAATYLYLADSYMSVYKPDRVVVQLGEDDFRTLPADPYWFQRTGSGWTVRRGVVIGTTKSTSRDLLTQVPALYYVWQRVKRSSADVATNATSSVLPAPDPGLVAWMADSLRAHFGPDCVVVYVPKIDYFGDVHEMKPTEVLVRRVFTAHGLRLFDMRDALDAAYAATRQTPQGFDNTQPGHGHLNALGHEVVAEQLLPILESGRRPMSANAGGH
jgi:hypothetical protein